jgi:lipopolysaccharide export system protein LptA
MTLFVRATRCTAGALAGALSLVLFTSGATQAQSRGQAAGPPGFTQNRNEPIKIESLSLEVRDKEKIAIFVDNVKVVQGDTTLECKKLIVYYDEEVAPTGARRPQAAESGGGQQQIRRLEAKGGVVVTQRDQTAVGDDGVYDFKSNSMTLTGNVVVTQGQNVIKGDRLWVDLATGVSRVETKGQGRVQSVFVPGSTPSPPASATQPPARNGSGATGTTSPGTARPQANGAERNRPPPGRPQRIN